MRNSTLTAHGTGLLSTFKFHEVSQFYPHPQAHARSSSANTIYYYVNTRALFDSEEASGSGNGMDVDESPMEKRAPSSKVSSKYMKKSTGFSDENSEWLTLKKEVRCFLFTLSFVLTREFVTILLIPEIEKSNLNLFSVTRQRNKLVKS